MMVLLLTSVFLFNSSHTSSLGITDDMKIGDKRAIESDRSVVEFLNIAGGVLSPMCPVLNGFRRNILANRNTNCQTVKFDLLDKLHLDYRSRFIVNNSFYIQVIIKIIIFWCI